MRYQFVKTPAFIRSARKIIKKQPDIFIDLKEVLTLLQNDFTNNRLKSLKLKGELKDLWACSLNNDLRIIFKFVDAIDSETNLQTEAILLVNIGSHDEVY